MDGKAWKIMVKGIFQLPPQMGMELLHANIWWSEGLDIINHGFTYFKDLTLYRKGIQRVDDVWDSECRDFLTKAQEKFKLAPADLGDWIMLINKLAEEWRPVLENNSDTTYGGQWVGFFYVVGKEDPIFVLKCTRDFMPQCLQFQHLVMPLTAQCFTVGTTHDASMNSIKLPGKWMAFFLKLESFIPLDNKWRRGKKKKSQPFTVKQLLLDGTQLGSDGLKGVAPLSTPQNWVEISLLKGSRGWTMLQTNGKATFLGITNSTGPRFGICCGLGRKSRSCGQFGIKW